MRGSKHPMGTMVRQWRVVTGLTLAAVAVAACGGPADDVAVVRDEPVQVLDAPADEPGERSDDAQDDAQEADDDPAADPDPDGADDDPDATDTDGADDTSQDTDGAGVNDLPDDVISRESGVICHLPVDAGGTPMQPQAYEDLVFSINGELERLVLAMDADLTELEEGISDGPTLEVALEEHAHTWSELIVPVVDLTPPAGAEDWHARATASWVDVCVAIVAAQAGVLDGDDERFEAFVDALREFPGLLNGLHANAALGPFEDG